MMRRIARMAAAPARRIAGDRRGSSAAEFAMTLPIWAMLIFSVINLARVYNGRAGVQNGLGEAARLATLWPLRSQGEMTAAFNGRAFGVTAGDATDVQYAIGANNGQNFVDITVTYTPAIDLFLIQVEPVTMTFTRRAFRPG